MRQRNKFGEYAQELAVRRNSRLENEIFINFGQACGTLRIRPHLNAKGEVLRIQIVVVSRKRTDSKHFQRRDRKPESSAKVVKTANFD